MILRATEQPVDTATAADKACFNMLGVFGLEDNWIHVLPKAATQVVGLWWGRGDFDRTLEVTCGIGHDVDCDAGQMLGVLGIMHGTAAISPRWSHTDQLMNSGMAARGSW